MLRPDSQVHRPWPCAYYSAVLLLLNALALIPAPSSHAYIDRAPTLASIINSSQTITIVEVAKFSADKHVVILKPVRSLKGQLPTDIIRQDIAPTDSTIIPRQIAQWASPGARAILFTAGDSALVCSGPGWYQVSGGGSGGFAKLGADRPDLPLAFYGSISRLTDAIDAMLAGHDAVITVVAFDTDNQGPSFDLALNRQNLPGCVRVQRLRANLKMPQDVASAAANPAYSIGPGPVDEDELPALIEKLKSSDATVRAEAVNDIRTLGSKARAAAASLVECLADSAPRVRVSAAAAVLRVAPRAADRTRALALLSQALNSSDFQLRRAAIQAVGFAGPAAAPLAARLGTLLKNTDVSTQVASIQAIALLGTAARDATAAVIPLLDDPAYAIDAADALGRIGSPAKEALPRLTRMLTSEQAAIRWAAVRAMAQIGGPDAHPAVEFMIHALPTATEVEGYNMLIYLSLLGPVAGDALPAIRGTRIKLNRTIPAATQWAIASDKTLPWLGGFQGGRGDAPAGTFIYQAIVRELGDRLRPTAIVLAKKIMEDTAGDVPLWGYEILACGVEDVLPILVPHLADTDAVSRERAAVALGYMGTAAAPAREQVAEAARSAATTREQRLMQWCLREIGAGSDEECVLGGE
ncbi:MAG: HEAT repeat domain-containing protein [Tepidisphaeraceae bacterium]